MRDGVMTLFLGGDAMTGRGIDQILPHPGPSRLWEPQVRDAETYVQLAEAAHGPVPRPVDFGWPWGDALRTLDEVAPDARLLNLETSITSSDDVDMRKAVHYRMSPANVGCLTAVRPDACVLANNHVLDFGAGGLAETVDTLAGAGVPAVGVGRDATDARRPNIHQAGGCRVVVVASGAQSSGIPQDWVATGDRPGIDVLPDLSDATAAELADRVVRVKRAGDVAVGSLHWGPNWGYEVSSAEVEFAHRLVDGGVDVVYGHSSHHPRPVEVYRGRLILYGCGDLVDDYEGIGGHEEFRDDLRLLYFASVQAATGALVDLRMAPVQAHRMRLRHASAEDAGWLRGVLDAVSRDFGARVGRFDGMLRLRCAS